MREGKLRHNSRATQRQRNSCICECSTSKHFLSTTFASRSCHIEIGRNIKLCETNYAGGSTPALSRCCPLHSERVQGLCLRRVITWWLGMRRTIRMRWRSVWLTRNTRSGRRILLSYTVKLQTGQACELYASFPDYTHFCTKGFQEVVLFADLVITHALEWPSLTVQWFPVGVLFMHMPQLRCCCAVSNSLLMLRIVLSILSKATQSKRYCLVHTPVKRSRITCLLQRSNCL